MNKEIYVDWLNGLYRTDMETVKELEEFNKELMESLKVIKKWGILDPEEIDAEIVWCEQDAEKIRKRKEELQEKEMSRAVRFSYNCDGLKERFDEYVQEMLLQGDPETLESTVGPDTVKDFASWLLWRPKIDVGESMIEGYIDRVGYLGVVVKDDGKCYTVFFDKDRLLDAEWVYRVREDDSWEIWSEGIMFDFSSYAVDKIVETLHEMNVNKENVKEN